MTSGYLQSPLQEPCSLQCTDASALCKINMANTDSNKRVVSQALLGSTTATAAAGAQQTSPTFVCLCALTIRIGKLHEARIYYGSGGWLESFSLSLF